MILRLAAVTGTMSLCQKLTVIFLMVYLLSGNLKMGVERLLRIQPMGMTVPLTAPHGQAV